jgi:hypothetical protein
VAQADSLRLEFITRVGQAVSPVVLRIYTKQRRLPGKQHSTIFIGCGAYIAWVKSELEREKPDKLSGFC